MDTSREILQFLHYNPLSSRDDIAKGISFEGSEATLKRLIAYKVYKELERLIAVNKIE